MLLRGTIPLPMKTRSKRSKREPKPETKSNATHEHDWVYTYQPRTELGRKLLELIRAQVESGERFLTMDEVLEEVHIRRGGVRDE